MTESIYHPLRTPRNKGILGQDLFFIKNKNIIWSLKVKESLLVGKYSTDEGQNWGPWMNLVFDFDGYFSFTIDGDNILHIICKNLKDNIVYVFWKKDEINVDVLERDFLLNERLVYQTLVLDKTKTLHLIYFTENPFDQLWHIKHSYKEEDWTLPCVVDEGIGIAQKQGAASIAPDGKIHLIYQVFDKLKYQLVHIENINNQWGNKKIITSSTRNNLSPSIIIDHNNTLHLTWIRSDGLNYRIMYRNKAEGGWMVGGWKNDQTLSSKGLNAYCPAIGIINNKVLIIWQQIDGIYECYSLDNGESFSDPTFKKSHDKFIQKNFISLDLYHNHNLSSITNFDTASTSIALLATLFQNDKTDSLVNLPDKANKQELTLPNMEHLSIDYGQKDLQHYINKINSNFNDLFFQTEDVRLSNLQMKETIKEKAHLIAELETKLLAKEVNKMFQNTTEKKQSALISELQKDINQKNIDCEETKKQLDIALNNLKESENNFNNTLQKLKVNNIALQKLLSKEQESKHGLKEELTQKDMLISELKEKIKNLTTEIHFLKKLPFWKRIK